MSTNQNNSDNKFMRLAFKKASEHLGSTKENPSVGCIIVKNGSVVSSGVTSVNGRPHAEYNAINFCKKSLKNSSLYVTLEPCSHYGKTPPCVKTIIENKIKRVFFSLEDPDIRSFNKSKTQFKKNKIIVRKGDLVSDIKNFYKSYFKYKKNSLPFVTAKMAISKDFYTNCKKKKWITNSSSRARVHLMRSNHDCILSSVNTIILDNPEFTCRICGLRDRSPSRIILDKSLKIPITSNIIKSANKYRTIIFFNKDNLVLLRNHASNTKKIQSYASVSQSVLEYLQYIESNWEELMK